MVLVVRRHPLRDGFPEEVLCHTAEEDCLLSPGGLVVAEVGEEGTVQDGLDLLGPVLFCLAGCEVPLEVCDRILLGVESVRGPVLCVVGALEVGEDDVLHFLAGTEDVVDFAVLLHSECLEEGNEGDGAGYDRYRDHECTIFLHFDLGQCTVSFFLGEHLDGGDGLSVLLCPVVEHPVGGEVLEGDEDPLGSANDEVSSGLTGILLEFDEFLVVFLIVLHLLLGLSLDLGPVEVAAFGLHHHGQVADVDPTVVVKVLLDTVLVDLEADVYGGHVVEVPEPCLHGGELVLVSVGLHHGRGLDANGGFGLGDDVPFRIPLPSDADLDVLSVGALGVELDDSADRVVGGHPGVIDDLLHPAVGVVAGREEVVEGFHVVVDDVFVLEVKSY